MSSLLTELPGRYPLLSGCMSAIEQTVNLLIRAFAQGNTFFVAGNGGSGADAEHIAGELLKGFLRRRPASGELQKRLAETGGAEGRELAAKLQQGLRCVSLLSHPGLLSAFANDVDASEIYAQQLYALARPGDVVMGISTGGNSENVRKLLITARALALPSVLLTGNRHGSCEAFADTVIAVDAAETYKIQELHLPVYHAICAAVEAHFFAE